MSFRTTHPMAEFRSEVVRYTRTVGTTARNMTQLLSNASQYRGRVSKAALHQYTSNLREVIARMNRHIEKVDQVARGFETKFAAYEARPRGGFGRESIDAMNQALGKFEAVKEEFRRVVEREISLHLQDKGNAVERRGSTLEEVGVEFVEFIAKDFIQAVVTLDWKWDAIMNESRRAGPRSEDDLLDGMEALMGAAGPRARNGLPAAPMPRSAAGYDEDEYDDEEEYDDPPQYSRPSTPGPGPSGSRRPSTPNPFAYRGPASPSYRDSRSFVPRPSMAGGYRDVEISPGVWSRERIRGRSPGPSMYPPRSPRGRSPGPMLSPGLPRGRSPGPGRRGSGGSGIFCRRGGGWGFRG